MLKYEIKLTDDSFKQEELVWSEKYLAPDLSFVSGVTSQDYHLEKFKKLSLTNKIVDNNNSLAEIETVNVTRQGYIVIKGKEYEVNSGSVVDYSVESSGTVTNYNYLFLNGKYYYADTTNTFHIDNWLTEKLELVGEEMKTSIVEDTIEAKKESDKNIAKIDTIVWIEDGIASIDGYDYYFDVNEQVDDSNIGGLKYYENSPCLDASAITKCDSIEYHPFASTSDYIEVTKLKLKKQEEISENFDKISFCRRFYYVKYKENYLPIRLDKTIFKCDIPNYLLGIEKENPTQSDYYKTVEKIVSGFTDDDTVVELSGETFDALLENISFVQIEDKRFNVGYDYMNANDGKEIAVYLERETPNVAIGDKIRFVDSYDSGHTQYVHLVSETEYKFNNDDTDFVLFNSKKYKIEKNLCDKAIINGNEYSIDYINGKEESGDCLVLIGEEKVPMYITSISDGEYSAGTLTRYGKIVSGDSKSAITATYDIIPYSGITVDNKKYTIVEDKMGEGLGSRYYAYLDKKNEYTFIVEDIVGSSMLVCTPDINTTDFTDEFSEFISREICQDVVDHQMYMELFTKNKIFGDKEIREELAFQRVENPTSSDDYFNLFDNLEVYTKNGYIHIPLLLGNSQGNNIMQDDIVENQFFNEVKKRAINPIVDMEKDVYYPKYITSNEGKYNGSDTDFDIIRQIRVNLHFRTRDLDSWKINDGYNNVATSGDTDNWFITDMNPYKKVIENTQWVDTKPRLYKYNKNDETKIKPVEREEALTELYESSDLIGLLNFTNDDVYYQKTKLAKSFLRFSYYDSTDPQTQSLLATSTVFIDEHKLFKKFIDNSRKNVNDFGIVTGVTYEISADGEYTMEGDKPKDFSEGSTIRKVSVLSEYLGARKDNGKKYLIDDNRYTWFDGVIMDDNHRIGSELIIDNKIATDTSSEGYYLYIFREYSENLYPKPIYMKVEFNHAGIGRTIPFIIPMKWSEIVDKDKYKTPERALTLSDSDLPILKEGVKLEDVYAQTYIPLYAVYDFKNKEYAYVFDNRYVRLKDNTITLNMFELKVQNEELPLSTTDEQVNKIQKEITMKQQITAKINVNKEQFPET